MSGGNEGEEKVKRRSVKKGNRLKKQTGKESRDKQEGRDGQKEKRGKKTGKRGEKMKRVLWEGK